MSTINLGKVVPEKGVDYYTDAEAQAFKEEITGELQSQITTNANNITALKSVTGTTTDTFSTESTYAVGDIVIKDHKYYRCKTAITTAGAWDSSKWDEINVRQELDEKETRIEELEESNKLILSNYDIGVATGSDMEITDALNGYNQGIAVVGNTTQVQSTGKNLFDKNGILATDISNWTKDSSNYFAFLELPNSYKTTITASIYLIGTQQNLVLALKDTIGSPGASARILNGGALSTPKTYDFSNSEHVYLVIGNTNHLSENLIELSSILNNYNIQIELGSTATDYEPYTNGQPTPAPDYPQPIVDVTGTQEVLICGSNLLDEKALLNATFATGTYKYTAISVPKDKTLYCKARLKSGKSAISGLTVYITNNGTNPNNQTRGSVIISNGSVTDEKSPKFNDSDTIYFSFYPTSKTIQEILDAYSFSISLIPNIEYEQYKELKDIMLHLGDIHLKGDENYKDSIIGSKDDWYKRSEKAEIILDGTESWEATADTSAGLKRYRITKSDMSNAYNTASVKSNYFKPGTYQDLNNASVDMIGILSSKRLTVATTIATVEDFKAWLAAKAVSDNPVVVEYPLDNATTIKITDQTLIPELNQLLPTQTYREHTIIQVTPATGNPAQIEIKYLKDDRVADLRSELELLKARVELLED